MHALSKSPDARALRKQAWARQALLKAGGEADGWAVGTCLWPFVAPGQRVPLERRAPRAGEIVAYQSNGALRAHRVLVVGERDLIIRADRPGSVLERVSREQVLGVWAARGERFNVFRTSAVGRVLAPALLMLSAPTPFAVLRGVIRRVRLSRRAVRVELATGPADELARELSEVGLTPRETSLEAYAERLLGTNGGFALIARRGRRPIGGLQVVASENGSHRLSLAVRRADRENGIEAELVEACIAEARRRSVGTLSAEVRRNDFRLRQVLRDSGFSLCAADLRRQGPEGEPLDLLERNIGLTQGAVP